MKFLLTLIISFSFAKTVTLVTSLRQNKVEVLQEAKLEIIFKRKLIGLGYDLKVIHSANAYDLHQELMDSENIAVFWISHGSFIKTKKVNPKGGIEVTPMVFDYRKDNVSQVFSLFHKKMEFLGIIGCNTKNIFEAMDITPRDISYHVTAPKTVATWGLRRAIRKFKRREKLKLKPPVESKLNGLIVYRTLDPSAKVEFLRPMMVFMGERLLDVLPPALPGGFRRDYIYYQRDEYADKDITMSTGQNPNNDPQEFQLGNIEIVDPTQQASWEVFRQRSGEPFGTRSRLFIYRSAAP